MDARQVLAWVFSRFGGVTTPSHNQFFSTIQGVLAGIWTDYDGATDLKRRGSIFIIGSRLPIRNPEIRL